MKTSPSFSLFVVSICSVFLLLAGCKDYGAGDPPTGDPLVTSIGTPVGESVSATIGENGGALVSADEKISLTIPAGALSVATEISIQPVTGEAPLGLGQGYRLLPHGLTFAKPVTLKFSYDSQLLRNTPEEFLWIVAQTANGSWNALLKSAVDPATKSVSCSTTHFSDWALARFVDLTITPVSPVVKKGESVKLELTGFLRDLPSDDDELAPLLPITSDGDVLTPLTPIPPVESRIMQFKVKRWNMNGSPAPVNNQNGSLSAQANSATYKAPNNIPDTNPVAVSASLETTNKEGKKSSYELVSNIRVGEDLSLTIKIDGKTFTYYQYGIDGIIPPDDPQNPGTARCVFEDNSLVIYAGDDNHTTFVGGVENPSVGTRVYDCKTYQDNMVFVYDDANYHNTYYKRTRFPDGGCNTESTCGEMSFKLTSFEGTFGSIVTGTFSGVLYEDKLSFWESCTTSESHPIEGKFTLMIYH
jgi:hypothetical protein